MYMTRARHVVLAAPRSVHLFKSRKAASELPLRISTASGRDSVSTQSNFKHISNHMASMHVLRV